MGLCCCARAFSSCGEQGAALLCGARALCARASVVVAHGLRCSVACGIFPDQGSNPCPLHWQADSQPLHHQGSPGVTFLKAVKVLCELCSCANLNCRSKHCLTCSSYKEIRISCEASLLILMLAASTWVCRDSFPGTRGSSHLPPARGAARSVRDPVQD